MGKQNCWEFMQCGREPGGKNSKELKLCPATIELRFNGVHGGENAGRCCWVVAGSFCRQEQQGLFAKKIKDCELCDFFRKVTEEESDKFQSAIVLLKNIRKE